MKAWILVMIIMTPNGEQAPPDIYYDTQIQCIMGLTAAKEEAAKRGWTIQGECMDTSNPVVRRYIEREREIRNRRK